MHEFGGFMIAGASSAENFGEIVGGFIGVGLILLGAIKCLRIMRRPTTSTLCVLSLFLLILAWFFSAISTFVPKVQGWDLAWLAVILKVVFVIMVMASLIIAIIGLANFNGSRHQQGKAQAITTIVLSSILILIGFSSFVVKAAQSVQSSSATGNKNGKLIEVKDSNFTITPNSGWHQMSPKALSELACVSIRRQSPEAFGLIIAEKSLASMDVEQYCEVVKSNLEMSADILDRNEEQVLLSGLNFRKINTKAGIRENNLLCEYEQWVACKGGHAWQASFWTTGSREDLSKVVRPVMESFRLIDPELDLSKGAEAQDVNRPELGYRTEIEGMGWLLAEVSEMNELEDFRVQTASEALSVIPLRFESGAPSLSAIQAGVLSVFDLENVPADEFKKKSWSPGDGLDGLELSIEREVNGTRFRYIFRIARGEKSAYMISGWATAKGGDMELVKNGMNAITLFPLDGAPPEMNKAQKKALGLVFNECGIYLQSKKKYEEAAECFIKGFHLGGDLVILANAGNSYEHAGLAEKGRDLLSSYVPLHPDNTHLGICFARLLALSGDIDTAEKQFIQLLDHGLKNEDSLLEFLQLLTGDEHYKEAMACASEWGKRMPSFNSRLWQAQTYSAASEFEKALLVFEALYEEYPDDLKVAYNLGECYNDAGESDKAEVLAKSLLKEGGELPRALMILGWSQMAREWYRDAKATFELAAKILPEDEAIKNAIKRASSELGQGDNTDVKNPIDPVEVPEIVVKAADPKPWIDAVDEGHTFVWLSKTTGYHFEKGKPIKCTTRRRVKILTNEGAREFSSIVSRFDPLSECIFMNRMEVRSENGDLITRAQPSDMYVRDESDGTASDRKLLHIQVAGVKPGTIVEWEITTQNRYDSDAFGFEKELFVTDRPCASEVVFVTGDVDEIRAELDQGDSIQIIRADHVRAWVQGLRDADVSEPYAVPEERRAAILWLGDKNSEWSTVGTQYLDEIKDRFVIEPEIKKRAQLLAKGHDKKVDKIAAVMSYVQKEITYQAIEFGVRRMRPNSPVETIRLGYGDCKDKALLLCQLLKSLDIPAYLALVNTDWLIESRLPSMNQFNHVVVHIPSLGENWMVDPTDEFLEQTSAPASGLWQSKAFVLDPDRPRLVEMPVTAPRGTCDIQFKRSAEIHNDDWAVNESIELTGYYASWMRAAFSGLSLTEQHSKAQRILSGQGNAQLHDFQFKDLDGLSAHARIQMSYTVRGGVNRINDYIVAALPALWEKDYLETKFIKNRKTPFRFLYPLHLTSEVDVKIPSKLDQGYLNSWGSQEESKFCSWKINAKSQGEAVKVTMTFDAKTGVYGPDHYTEMHHAWENARQAWNKPVNWPN